MAENQDPVIPPVVNFDKSQNLPGTISVEERYKQDLNNRKKKNQDPIPQQAPQSSVSLPEAFAGNTQTPVPPKSLQMPPSIPPHPPLHNQPQQAILEKVIEPETSTTKDEQSELIPENIETGAIEENDAKAISQTPVTPVTPITESHSTETIADAINTARQTERSENRPEPTPVPIPEDIPPVTTPSEEQPTSSISDDIPFPTIESDDTPPEGPQGGILAGEEPLPDAIPDPKHDALSATNHDEVEPDPFGTDDTSSIHAETGYDDESSVKKVDLTTDVPLENAADNAPDDGTFIQSMSEEEASKIMMDELNRENKDVLTSPQKLNEAQVIELNDYTTTHFRILESMNPEVAKLKGADINLAQREMVDVSAIPDYELKSVDFEKSILDGDRKVQIVCVQSGYTCMVSPMKSRELRTFGRRESNEDSYAFEMAICHAIYSKLSEFSCGAMRFEQWLNTTSYADLQTLMFGLYHATYPSKNLFTFDCNYCGENISVYVDSNTLACVPPGSMAQEHINLAISGKIEPRKMQELSQRWRIVDIFIDHGRRFFRIRTPSIFEFLENAFHNKKDEIIMNNYQDMIYAGYIRAVGLLDIKHYNATGKAKYYVDNRIEAIDRAIATISPDEKRRFERMIINYITKYSVAYQIPRTRCSKCGRIISQRDINTRTLFFDVKAQKGFR